MSDKELMESMELPKGMTCSDCAHWKFCQSFIGLKGNERTCDWAPSRFYQRTLMQPESNLERSESGESSGSPRPALEVGLECAMCGAQNAFVISPLDPSVGYCFKEEQVWRISRGRNHFPCATCGTEYLSMDNECSNGCANERVTVCGKCLQASCWQGIFMCDKAENAGTTELTRRELLKLDREHPSYWKSDEQIASA